MSLKLAHSFLSPLPLYKGTTHALVQSTGIILVTKHTFTLLLTTQAHLCRGHTFRYIALVRSRMHQNAALLVIGNQKSLTLVKLK